MKLFSYTSIAIMLTTDESPDHFMIGKTKVEICKNAYSGISFSGNVGDSKFIYYTEHEENKLKFVKVFYTRCLKVEQFLLKKGFVLDKEFSYENK